MRSSSLCTEYTLPGLPETTEPLRVDVEQLARSLPLVAARAARLGSVRPRQTVVAVPAQDLPDRRWRVRDEPRQPHRSVAGLDTSREDALLGDRRHPTRLTMRSRRPVTQTSPPVGLIAPPQPIGGRTAATAAGRGQRRTHTPPACTPQPPPARPP